MKSNLQPTPLKEHVPSIVDGSLSRSLSRRQVARLLLSGKIVDGRAGGLVFGRSIMEGGVAAIFKLGSRYEFRGWLEGGSFVVNWKAATENLPRLKAMISGLTLREQILPGKGNHVIVQPIVTFGRPDDRIVLLTWCQMVVPPEPAAKHLAELEEMNQAPNPFTQCDLREVFGWETSDDLII